MLVCLILMYKDNLFCGKLVIDSKQSAQNFENDEKTANYIGKYLLDDEKTSQNLKFKSK